MVVQLVVVFISGFVSGGLCLGAALLWAYEGR